MSTRATYRFITPTTDITLYIHHDGYPQGAAIYFSKGKEVASFIHNNERAEIVSSHESHGDTEYRYTKLQAILKPNFYVDHKDDLGNWVREYTGTLANFLSLEGEI